MSVPPLPLFAPPAASAAPVRRRFLRSVHLERDAVRSDSLDGYLITPQVRAVLGRVFDGLARPDGNRAWTLTGPYGTGKSAFALFASALLAEGGTHGPTPRTALVAADRHLSATLVTAHGADEPRPFLPVRITGDQVSVTACLVRGLREALRPLAADAPTLATFVADLAGEDAPELPAAATVARIAAAARLVAETGRYRGLVIVLDEMGKVLEHAARHPRTNDLFVLQELAEQANRSGDTPVAFLGILHQAFERYIAGAGDSMRHEWAKVGGRFEDIAFQEPPDATMHLIAAAIEAPPDAAREHVGCVLETSPVFCPSSMQPDEFTALALRAFPLHPATLVALPYLFRRFAQNDRSVFAWLGSHEPYGYTQLRAARASDADGDPFIRLPDVFDYMAANFGPALSVHAHARRWTEAIETLDRLRSDGTGRDIALIKAIGVLGSTGEISPLQPTQAALIGAVAHDDTDRLAYAETLRGLQRRKLVTHRRYNDTYRLWEGGDVDLEERLAAARRAAPGPVSVAATLAAYAPPRPLVARRHSYRTGTLRSFAVRYVDGHDAATFVLPPPAEDGLLVCFLPQTYTEAEACCGWAARGDVAARVDVIVAVPEQLPHLAEPLAALRDVRWVREHTPELTDDRATRREVEAQITELEGIVRARSEQVLRAGLAEHAAGCRWFWRGKQRATNVRRGVARLISDVFDEHYRESPELWNELVNRRTLSSAAAAGRRDLMQAMLEHPERERLGRADGLFPPAVSMYESVLHQTGLHRRTESGRWAFGPPPENDPTNLRPAWAALDAAIFPTAEAAPVSVAAVQSRLAAAPFGVTAGVFPVLLLAFTLAHGDEVSLYREGTLVPEPGIADWEVLMRRPELFAITGMRVAGERAAVVARLARGFDVAPAVLPFVRKLMRTYRQLPLYAQRTRNLPEHALLLRESLKNARAPERLLFADLPRALGCPPLDATEADDAAIDTLFVRLNAALEALAAATPAAILNARDVLLAACGLPTSAEGWAAFRQMARELDGTVTHPSLAPVLRRAALVGDDGATLESTLAAVVTRPPASWTDADVTQFGVQAGRIGALLEAFTASVQPLPTAQHALAPPADPADVRRVRDSLPTDLPLATLCVVLRELLAQLAHDEETARA